MLRCWRQYFGKASRWGGGFWLASALLVAALAFWGWSAAPPLATATDAPTLLRSLPPSPVTDTTYDRATDMQLKVFAEAMNLVRQHYVDKKTGKELVYGAIQGAVGFLDPHSAFMTPEEYRELQIETKG